MKLRKLCVQCCTKTDFLIEELIFTDCWNKNETIYSERAITAQLGNFTAAYTI